MNRVRVASRYLAALVPALLAFASPARATEFTLGEAAASTSWQLDSGGLVGHFTDDFSFSVGNGDSLFMTSSLSTGFWTVASMSGVTATLSCDGAVIARGLIGGDDSPETTIAFTDVAVGPGQYRLQIDGFEQSFLGFDYPMSYGGSLSFSDTASAVDEPLPATLLLGGLALFAGARRRRRPD